MNHVKGLLLEKSRGELRHMFLPMLGFLKVISSSLCTVFCLVYMKLTSAQKCDIP